MFERLVSLSVGVKGTEDYIRTFQDMSELARNLGEAHRYVNVSVSLTDDVVENEPEELYHDDFTLVKVRDALNLALTTKLETRSVQDIITDCISNIQSAGILFRERPRLTENASGDRR